jgi:hypothetical protein
MVVRAGNLSRLDGFLSLLLRIDSQKEGRRVILQD